MALQLSDAPLFLCSLAQIPLTSLRISNSHYQTVMTPWQFARQCLANLGVTNMTYTSINFEIARFVNIPGAQNRAFCNKDYLTINKACSTDNHGQSRTISDSHFSKPLTYEKEFLPLHRQPAETRVDGGL